MPVNTPSDMSFPDKGQTPLSFPYPLRISDAGLKAAEPTYGHTPLEDEAPVQPPAAPQDHGR